MNQHMIGIQKCRANERCDFIHISDGFLSFTGYTAEDIRAMGNNFFALVHPDDVQRVRGDLAAQTSVGDGFCVDYRVVRKDGEAVWVHDQGFLVEEAGERFYYCEIMEASKYYNLDMYYKNVLNSLPNPVCITNLDNKIIFINRAAEKIYGRKAEACVGQPCAICNSPLCGTRDCCRERFLRGETAAEQVGPDGDVNRVNFSPLLDEEGTLIGYISVSTDITELKQAEQRLALSDERYRIALSQSRNFIWEYDAAQRTIHLSDPQAQTAQEVYGLTSPIEDAPERLIALGVVPEDSEKSLLSFFEAAQRGEKYVVGVFKMRTKAGDERYVHNSMTNFFDPSGRFVRSVGLCRDITEEKELEISYQRESQYRQSVFSDALSTYEIDLTADRLLRVDSDWFKTLDLPESVSYSQMIEIASRKVVHKAFSKAMYDALNREGLLNAFTADRKEVSCEYPRLTGSGAMTWVLTTMNMVRSLDDGHVYAFVHIRSIEDRKRKEESLRHQAEIDSLTGLLNRRTAHARIDRELQESVASGETCALMMLDVDNFKAINDTFGHVYGDAVLSELANKMRGMFRREDVLSRIGGDEFIIFPSGALSEEVIREKAAQLCKLFSTVYSSADRQCVISCSIGIAFAPRDGVTFEALYDKADAAMYYAKNMGKNRYAIYNPAMPQLRAAGERNEFETSTGKSFSENVIEYIFKILYHSDDLEFAITSVLGLMAKHYGAHHCYIIECGPDEAVSMTYEWTAEGVPAVKPHFQSVPAGAFGYPREIFGEDGIYALDDVRKAVGLGREMADRAGAKALVVAQLKRGDRFMGLLGMDDCSRMRRCTPAEREVLASAAAIISTFLANERGEQEKAKYANALNEMLDNAEAATYVIDPASYRVIFANKKIQALIPGEMGNAPCHKLFRDYDAPCPECPLSHLQRNPQACEAVEIYNKKLNLWVETAANWVTWSDGRRYAIISCNDITRYKTGRT